MRSWFVVKMEWHLANFARGRNTVGVAVKFIHRLCVCVHAIPTTQLEEALVHKMGEEEERTRVCLRYSYKMYWFLLFLLHI